MSAWSDWQCGAISEQEYKTAYNMDPAEDHGEDPAEYDDSEEYEGRIKHGNIIFNQR